MTRGLCPVRSLFWGVLTVTEDAMKRTPPFGSWLAAMLSLLLIAASPQASCADEPATKNSVSVQVDCEEPRDQEDPREGREGKPGFLLTAWRTVLLGRAGQEYRGIREGAVDLNNALKSIRALPRLTLIGPAFGSPKAIMTKRWRIVIPGLRLDLLRGELLLTRGGIWCEEGIRQGID